MTTRSTSVLLLSVMIFLAAGIALLEVGSRWMPPPPRPPEKPPARVSPYYTPSKEGSLRFGDVCDNKSAGPAKGSEAVWPAPLGGGNRPSWKKWEKYEARFSLSWTFANPYNPDEIAVDALVTTPSGRIETAPAFWYVPCENRIGERDELVRNPGEDTRSVEVIEQTGPGTWMLRYAPREEGEYTYLLVARTPTKSAYSQPVIFNVEGQHGRGLVRPSRRDSRYFEFDDGSFFFPIGENVAWPNDLGTVNFDSYMANLRHYGANWARLWLTSYFRGTTIEWSPVSPWYHGLGFYSAEVAWKLDRMLESAEKHGVYLMWCIQQHAQFISGPNGCWKDNPYNKEAGGFLDEPGQFFTHPLARKLFRQRMRYYAARYGFSPNLFAWEFWNEVALSDRFDGPACTVWHKEMGDCVKALDVTGRAVTTSYYVRWENEAFGLDTQDFAQLHVYSSAPLWWTVEQVQEQRKFGKPVLVSEYGLGNGRSHFRVEEDSVWPVDPEGLHIHNGLWAGLFSGSAGTAMTWWWDLYIDTNNLYHHFLGISRFLAGEDLRRWQLRQVTLFDDPLRTPKVFGYVLCGPERAYGWLVESTYTMEYFSPGEKPCEKVRVALDGLEDGDYWVDFWNTCDGVVTSRLRRTVEDGKLSFEVPAFRGDVAFKLYRGKPAAPITSDTPSHDRFILRLRELGKRFGR